MREAVTSSTCFSDLLFSYFKDAAGFLHVISSRKRRIPILHDVSGIIRPGRSIIRFDRVNLTTCLASEILITVSFNRLTLLLGPPGSGKTTLLRALSGKLPSQLTKVIFGTLSHGVWPCLL